MIKPTLFLFIYNGLEQAGGFVIWQKKPSPCFCYPIHGHWS